MPQISFDMLPTIMVSLILSLSVSCSVLTFRLAFFSFAFSADALCVYVSMCDGCECVLRLFIFSGVHRLTTFTTLFMFTMYASPSLMFVPFGRWMREWEKNEQKKVRWMGNTHSANRHRHHHEIAKQKNSKWARTSRKKIHWNTFTNIKTQIGKLLCGCDLLPCSFDTTFFCTLFFLTHTHTSSQSAGYVWIAHRRY